MPRKLLELLPYPEDGSAAGQGFMAVRENHNMLFLPANLNGKHEGYLLLDTGSAFNAISDATVLALKDSGALAPAVNLFGGVMTRRNSMNVSGVIGYPALAGSVVTVSYR
jgi:hypothetical protein